MSRQERLHELAELYGEAVAAVDGGAVTLRALERDAAGLRIAGKRVAPDARLFALAVGKAAAPMAAALEAQAGPQLCAGLVVTKDGHGAPLVRFALREAAHPVPDERSRRAAREALALVDRAGPEDVLVVLLSGGASSLLAEPAPGLTLDDVARGARVLMEAGADIAELNALRKHTSAIAGGRLACRARAGRIEVLVISDVPGDRIDVIGSGPLAPDPTGFSQVRRAIARRGLERALPARLLAHLDAGVRGEVEETPKPGDPRLARVRHTLLASNATAVEAVSAAARRRGLRVRRATTPLSGEARLAGAALADEAERARDRRPLYLLAGGETTVTVRGDGRGGRSQELALAAALRLDGRPPTALLAAGTDGTDGPTEAAGAYADEGTLARARARGLDARAALERNDSYAFFREEGGLFVTGPTRTNVMDLALLRVDPASV